MQRRFLAWPYPDAVCKWLGEDFSLSPAWMCTLLTCCFCLASPCPQALQFLGREPDGRVQEHLKAWKEYFGEREQRLYYCNDEVGHTCVLPALHTLPVHPGPLAVAQAVRYRFVRLPPA
jgi:hypothetical protein